MHHANTESRRMSRLLDLLLENQDGVTGKQIMEHLGCMNPATEISALRHAIKDELLSYEIPSAELVGRTDNGCKIYRYKIVKKYPTMPLAPVTELDHFCEDCGTRVPYPGRCSFCNRRASSCARLGEEY